MDNKSENQQIRPRFLFADLIYEIEPAGYQPVDLRSTVDTAAALQLFMGNRLYSDKRFRDFVRVHFPHARSSVSIAEADGYNEQWQQRILASFAPKH